MAAIVIVTTIVAVVVDIAAVATAMTTAVVVATMTMIVVVTEADDVTEMIVMGLATSIAMRADHATMVMLLHPVSDVVVEEATTAVKSVVAVAAVEAVLMTVPTLHPLLVTKLHVNMVEAAEVTIVRTDTAADKSTVQHCITDYGCELFENFD